ncbi:MAG: methyltransferase domain-containing protein [Gammaproteobacteria bacterium]|nr:methyltransferase domain-containing protein [Gammaproteobacteria bacterium]
MIRRFYELVTDFYEFAWGSSFHFAPTRNGASFEESIVSHQYFLADALALSPGMKVLDVGCGVGGPQRSIAKKYRVYVTGLNISEYQLQKCEEYNEKSDLQQLCHTLHGDFMAIPAEDETFDVAYHIEAIPHAPDKKGVYDEIFRVLKPGGFFAGYDWCMTPSYDADCAAHRQIKKDIEFGNALPQIATFTNVNENLQAAGFELLETRDRALDADTATPWYSPLEGSVTTLRGFPRSRVGRKLISTLLHALEKIRVVPKGTFETCEILNIAADSLVAGGRLGIFTPMYFHSARKP